MEGSDKEIEISFAEELGEGEMRELKVGEGEEDKILITRYQGKIHAVGNYCTHFGAPLNTGILFDDKVLCPWHGAGFNVVTGAVDGAPSLDGLPVFKVTQKDSKLFVTVPEKLPKKRTMPLSRRDPSNKLHYVIIGGGPAGLNCAETLRQSGFTGQVTLLSAEDLLPYDRTLLTKVLPSGDGSRFVLRNSEFLNGCDIEVRLNTLVKSVNEKDKKVQLANGETIVRSKFFDFLEL